MLRYLNMFIVIGLILIGVSFAGFLTQDHFLMEPGQAKNGHLALIYLGAGFLMLLNGIVSIRLAPPSTVVSTKSLDQPDSNRDIEAEAKDGIIN